MVGVLGWCAAVYPGPTAGGPVVSRQWLNRNSPLLSNTHKMSPYALGGVLLRGRGKSRKRLEFRLGRPRDSAVRYRPSITFSGVVVVLHHLGDGGGRVVDLAGVHHLQHLRNAVRVVLDHAGIVVRFGVEELAELLARTAA